MPWAPEVNLDGVVGSARNGKGGLHFGERFRAGRIYSHNSMVHLVTDNVEMSGHQHIGSGEIRTFPAYTGYKKKEKSANATGEGQPSGVDQNAGPAKT